MPGSISSKLATGAIWMVLLNSIERGLGMISILILARLLEPADFGVVAMATSFLALTVLFSAFGFDVALIHNQNATEDHYHSAWTMNFVVGAALTVVVLLAAKPIAVFYGKPEVFWVVCVLAALPLIGALENIGVVAFRKELNFRREFMFQISRKVVGFAVTLPLALWLRNYWALVIGMLAARAAGTITSYYAHPFRPHFLMSHTKELFKFSRWLLLNNGVSMLNERLTDFAIGRSAGPAALGIYNVVYEFAHLPKTEIGAPINRALLPGFAKMTDDEGVRSIYLKATEMLAMVALPAAIGLSAIAPFFVPTVLGSRWSAGAPVMEILACSGALLMFQATIGSLLIARGRPDSTVRLNAAYLCVFAPAALFMVGKAGIVGAALAALAASLVMTVFYFVAIRAALGVSLRDIGRAIVRPIFSVIVMYSVVRSCMAELPVFDTLGAKVAALFGLVVLGGVVYVFSSVVLWIFSGRPHSAERAIFEILARRLGPNSKSDASRS